MIECLLTALVTPPVMLFIYYIPQPHPVPPMPGSYLSIPHSLLLCMTLNIQFFQKHLPAKLQPFFSLEEDNI